MSASILLPPPTTFEHKETLHRIELPPLARFLHTLTAPNHLLKLNEILNRYRTPKSYHRIDIREISSSELPPSDSPEPDRHPDGVNGRNHLPEDVTDGEPIELEDGVTIDEAQASRKVKPVPADSSPEAKHPLPPSGPKRRTRELRVDLRTLDPAALFTLENWRREVLKLESLPFDHPDSIWYQSPVPEPVPVSTVKKGRPRKQRTSASVQAEVMHVDLTGDDSQEADVNTSTKNGVDLERAVAEASVSTEIQPRINDVEAFDNMVDGPQPTPGADTPNDPTPVAPQSALADLFGTEDPVQPLVRSVEAAEQVRPRSPSPEAIIIDAYDHDPEKDPDYAPAHPTPPRRSGRPRDKAKATASSRSVFTKAASPVPMLPTRSAGSSRRSAFTRVASPIPIIPIEKDIPLLESEILDAVGMVEEDTVDIIEIDNLPRRSSRLPMVEIGDAHRTNIPSPKSAIASPRPLFPPIQSVGTSSHTSITVSDSPERPPPPPVLPERVSAFQPFVREQMRIPTSAKGSARPQWLTDLPDLNSSLDEPPTRQSTGKRKGKSTGTSTEYGSEGSFTKKKKTGHGESRGTREGDDDDDVSIVEPSEVGSKASKRKEPNQDDEWADFIF